MSIRKPAWAGSFYPADPDELSRQIKTMAQQATVHSGQLRAVIMPHAGYIYSGTTASYAEHDIRKANPKTIILLGPDHHVGMAASHICREEYWQSPLGRVKLSKKTEELLERYPRIFRHNSLSDQKEHSLEVIVPFLQTWLDNFELLPVVTGQVDPEPLAAALLPLLDNNTLLVISSDLSHFLNDAEARNKDADTINAILNMDIQQLALHDNRACGLIPIAVLISIAETLKWQPQLLHYATSSDSSGDKSRVVGYAAIGFYEEDSNENN
jgi:AmmeMemoRadiSam system protein B